MCGIEYPESEGMQQYIFTGRMSDLMFIYARVTIFLELIYLYGGVEKGLMIRTATVSIKNEVDKNIDMKHNTEAIKSNITSSTFIRYNLRNYDGIVARLTPYGISTLLMLIYIGPRVSLQNQPEDLRIDPSAMDMGIRGLKEHD